MAVQGNGFGAYRLPAYGSPPGLIDRLTSRFPLFSLVIGSALSLTLALMCYLGLRARRISAHVRRVNEVLSAEIRLREQVEEQLRRARVELNLPVQDRAAVLEEADTKLSRETVYQQELIGRLFRVQHEERRRLARELHDGTTQNLIAVAMNFSRLRKYCPPECDADVHVFSDSVQLIDQSIRELRTISHLLHPPMIEELGLPATLRSYADGFAARSGIQVFVEIDSNLGRMDPAVELMIFRVVQECLANVHRHSHARTARISVVRDEDALHLEVADDGQGMSLDMLKKIKSGTAGVGIAGMQERARLLGGQCEINSSIHGTGVRIQLPLSGKGAMTVSRANDTPNIH